MLLLVGCHFHQLPRDFWNADQPYTYIKFSECIVLGKVLELIWKCIHDGIVISILWSYNFIFTFGSLSTMSSKSALNSWRKMIFLLGKCCSCDSILFSFFFFFCRVRVGRGEGEMKEFFSRPGVFLSPLLLWYFHFVHRSCCSMTPHLFPILSLFPATLPALHLASLEKFYSPTPHKFVLSCLNFVLSLAKLQQLPPLISFHSSTTRKSSLLLTAFLELLPAPHSSSPLSKILSTSSKEN